MDALFQCHVVAFAIFGKNRSEDPRASVCERPMSRLVFRFMLGVWAPFIYSNVTVGARVC